MAWQLVFGFETGSDVSFTVNESDRAPPMVEPSWDFVYDDTASQSELVEVRQTWDIRDCYFLNNVDVSTMVGKLTSLISDFSDAGDICNEVALKLDSTAKFSMKISDGWNGLRVNSLSVDPFTEGCGTSYVRFSVNVSAFKVLQATSISGTYSYDYDNQGLETRSLRVQVKTASGTSAKSVAQNAAQLSLPSSYWAYQTAKSPYASVSTNRGDTEAEATCTIKEQYQVHPSGCNAYTTRTQTSSTADGRVVTLTVTAQGSGAEAAVAAAKPTKTISSSVEKSDATLEVSATYVTEEKPENPAIADTVISRTRVFTVSGGGKTRTYTPIPGLDIMWLTVGPRKPLVLHEECTVRAIGPADLSGVLIEAPLFLLNLDSDQSSSTQPYISESKLDKDSEVWERSASRVYVFGDALPTEEELFEAVKNSSRLTNLDIASSADWIP